MKRLIDGLMHPREHRWAELRPWRQHSQVLIVSGLVYVIVGISYVVTEPTDARYAALRLATVLMPLHAWGWIWIVCGGMVFVSARWPPVSETWGYSVLTTLSFSWSFVYAAGVLFLNAPSSAISGSLLWGLVAYLWYKIAGLTNPVVIYATPHDPPEVVTGE